MYVFGYMRRYFEKSARNKMFSKIPLLAILSRLSHEIILLGLTK